METSQEGRSEERLTVDTTREQTGQARLRKTVSGEVRKEHIEADLPGGRRHTLS